MKSTLRKVLKWTLGTLAAILLLLLVAYVVIYFQTEKRLNKTYEVDVAHLTIPTDSASIALGKHVVATRGCEDCHGKNLAGKIMIDDPGLGRIVAANLTSGEGGSGRSYSDEDWVRAIRHGVGTDKKPLLVMPSKEFFFISNTDMANMIAYIKSLPPVNNYLPQHELRPLSRILYVAGPLAGLTNADQIDHTAENTLEQKPQVTAAYGKYLAVSCSGCHAENFGGKEMEIPGMKASANITSTGDVGEWTESEFMTVLKTGKRPDGRQLNNKDMPWEMTKNFTDDEMKSIYLFLRSLPGNNLQTSTK